jgi:hypothetical protein
MLHSSTAIVTQCPVDDAGSKGVRSLAAPVEPAELAAATLAHQASLDLDDAPGAALRQQLQWQQALQGRDAGSLSYGAPLVRMALPAAVAGGCCVQQKAVNQAGGEYLGFSPLPVC